jgi:hypothetical protein
MVVEFMGHQLVNFNLLYSWQTVVRKGLVIQNSEI